MSYRYCKHCNTFNDGEHQCELCGSFYTWGYRHVCFESQPNPPQPDTLSPSGTITIAPQPNFDTSPPHNEKSAEFRGEQPGELLAPVKWVSKEELRKEYPQPGPRECICYYSICNEKYDDVFVERSALTEAISDRDKEAATVDDLTKRLKDEYELRTACEAKLAEAMVARDENGERMAYWRNEAKAEREKLVEQAKYWEAHLNTYKADLKQERERADTWEKDATQARQEAYAARAEVERLKLEIAVTKPLYSRRKLEAERDALKAEVERLDARYRAKLDQFNALEMLTKERDRLQAELSRERDIWHDLHNGLNARNERYAKALERILNEGNMAAQGHWDATDKMKVIAYEALGREGT